MKKISKRGGGVPEEGVEVLKQLIESLEKAEKKLEKAYKREKYEDFTKLRKFILETQQKISGYIK